MPTKNSDYGDMVLYADLNGDYVPISNVGSFESDVVEHDAPEYSKESLSLTLQIKVDTGRWRKAMQKIGFSCEHVFPKKHRRMRSIRRRQKCLRIKDKLKRNNNSKEK